MIDSVKRLGKIALIVSGTYCCSLLCLELPSVILSQGIESQSQLEELLAKEKKKLNCDKNIKAKLTFDYNNPISIKNEDGSYEIFLSEFGHNVSTLRHELYHIADGHLDNPNRNWISYFFWYEPQAALYESFGLKL